MGFIYSLEIYQISHQTFGSSRRKCPTIFREHWQKLFFKMQLGVLPTKHGPFLSRPQCVLKTCQSFSSSWNQNSPVSCVLQTTGQPGNIRQQVGGEYITQTVSELIAEIFSQSFLLQCQSWWSYQITHLHMPRQLSCHGMCKIVAWLARYLAHKSNIYLNFYFILFFFPQDLG